MLNCNFYLNKNTQNQWSNMAIWYIKYPCKRGSIEELTYFEMQTPDAVKYSIFRTFRVR